MRFYNDLTLGIIYQLLFVLLHFKLKWYLDSMIWKGLHFTIAEFVAYGDLFVSKIWLQFQINYYSTKLDIVLICVKYFKNKSTWKLSHCLFTGNTFKWQWHPFPPKACSNWAKQQIHHYFLLHHCFFLAWVCATYHYTLRWNK